MPPYLLYKYGCFRNQPQDTAVPDGAQRHRRYAQHLHPPGAGGCCCGDGQDGGGRGGPERAGEAFGRIRTDGVITENVQDGMNRRAGLTMVVGLLFCGLRECRIRQTRSCR